MAHYDLVFDGEDDYIEIPDSADFSVATTGQLSVSAWIRPDVLTFPVFQSTGYVHWMGKGEAGQHEWVFRMYNQDTHGTAPLRIGTRDRESFFLGAIREVRIWSRALTAAEVDVLYGGSVPQDGLVAEYLLRQDIALDSTGLCNGFIMGASWVPS
jgi:hypothetical protein